MEILVFIITWIIGAALPTLIVLIPSFFILKSKKLNRLSHYLTVSSIAGFLVLLFLKLTPYLLSNLQSLQIGNIIIISDGYITNEGYFYYASRSLIGALMAGLIGLAWWFILVKPPKLK